MSQQSPPERGERRWNWVSVALFVIGLLILVPAGLCTTVGLLFAFGTYGSENLSMVQLVLAFGGVPMALGALLVWAGLATRQRG
jgi:membrane protein implicated in regulation of membrane protease activity